MASVSISKAAKLAGVSRSTLYATYINKGVISVSADARGRKSIETSELLRVFGSLKPDTVQDKKSKVSSSQSTNESDRPDNQDTVQDSKSRTGSDSVDIELKMMREQLAEAKQQIEAFTGRESWYQSQIKTLTDTVKLLEDKSHNSKASPGFSLVKLWNDLWK